MWVRTRHGTQVWQPMDDPLGGHAIEGLAEQAAAALLGGSPRCGRCRRLVHPYRDPEMKPPTLCEACFDYGGRVPGSRSS